MSQTVQLKKWTIVSATILGLAAPVCAVWGDRQMVRHTEVTVEGIRNLLHEEMAPLSARMSALELRTALNESELTTYRATFIPTMKRVDRLSMAIAKQLGLNPKDFDLP